MGIHPLGPDGLSASVTLALCLELLEVGSYIVVLVPAHVVLLPLVAGVGAVDAESAEEVHDFPGISLHFVFDCHGKELLDCRTVKLLELIDEFVISRAGNEESNCKPVSDEYGIHVGILVGLLPLCIEFGPWLIALLYHSK